MSIKDRVRILATTISNKEMGEDQEMMLDIVHGFEKNCIAYIEGVANMENVLNIGRFRLEPEDYRAEVRRLDERRSILHNVVIGDCTILNRFCQSYNIENIYEGNLADRYEVAEFAKKYIDELWQDRQI